MKSPITSSSSPRRSTSTARPITSTIISSVALSEHIFHSGIEHHESSLNTLSERARSSTRTLRESGASGLLPHEFTHSWNGKYRRPGQPDDAGFPGADAGRHALGVRGDDPVSRQLRADGAFRSGQHRLEPRMAGVGRQPCSTTAPGGPGVRCKTLLPMPPIFTRRPAQWHEQRRGVDFYPEGVLALAGSGHASSAKASQRPAFHRRFLPRFPRRPERSALPW